MRREKQKVGEVMEQYNHSSGVMFVALLPKKNDFQRRQ